MHVNVQMMTLSRLSAKSALASKFERYISSTCFDLLFSSVSVYLFPQKDQIAITLVKQILYYVALDEKCSEFQLLSGLQ